VTWIIGLAESSSDPLRGEFPVTEDKRLIMLTMRSELRDCPRGGE